MTMAFGERIESRDNRRLVQLRKLRDGKDKSLLFIEGRRLFEEALRSPIKPVECFVSERLEGSDVLDAAVSAGIETHIVADRAFATVADTENSQGMILTAERPNFEASALAADERLVLFLHGVSNPSNLGAILRTAEAAGCKSVIVSHGSADVYSPKALRASMGSAFRLQVWQGAEFDRATSWASENGYATVALDVSGRISYTDIDWKRRNLLILGSEAHGLTAEELSSVDKPVIIPMQNGVESLNVAVAAGVVLFEAKRAAEA